MKAPIPTSVARVLDRALDQRPDAEAVVARSGALSYREFDHRIAAAAGGLWELGVRGGERVAAIVEPDPSVAINPPTAQRLREHCDEQLAAYKIPETWAVVAALPRNAMGKIVRTQLPALFASATRLDAHTHA